MATTGTVTTNSVGFYGFFLNMWIMRRITEPQLQLRVPKYLTQEEVDMIVATPQIPE